MLEQESNKMTWLDITCITAALTGMIFLAYALAYVLREYME